MKFLVLTFFLVLASSITFSQVVNKNDTLYVWAESGLKLRLNHLPDSEVLISVPYGSPVLSFNHISSWSQDASPITEIPKISINNKEYPAIVKHGKYIAIQYQDIVGFVNNAYLSRLSTLNLEQEIKPYRSRENFKSYFDKEFGLLKTISTADSSVNSFASNIYLYQNGYIIDERFSSNGNGWEYSYLFIDLSLNEVYLLVNSIKSFEKQYKTLLNDSLTGEYYPYKYNSEAISLQTGLFEITEIKKIGNYVLVKMEGGN